jgi:predicted ArsR family transcriptional regulator
MEERFLIDKETLKAIAVDTRLNILKLLAKKKYTLSDISDMLGLGNSTIKEHMDNLLKAELVDKEETGRKWKYYSLTLKGRRFVEPREIKVLFMFALSTIGAIASAVWFAAKASIIEKTSIFAGESRNLMAEATFNDMAQEKMVGVVQEQAVTAAQTAGINPWLIFGMMAVLVGLSAFLLGYYMKKNVIIIQKTDKGGRK